MGFSLGCSLTPLDFGHHSACSAIQPSNQLDNDKV
jgi:hypothetical protein